MEGFFISITFYFKLLVFLLADNQLIGVSVVDVVHMLAIDY
ncbi:hypothetical protein [Pedobacter foliorum]|nr:hypothetical protein [Pedobacter foliorum]